MKISIESKGDFNAITDWLKEDRNPSVIANTIGSEGSRSLAAKTPKDTGETASSWKHKVTNKGDVTEVAWYNTAHPGAGVNVAKLIDIGHGTGTGGYIPPRPYIEEAMKPIWSNVDNKIVKELIK